MAVPPPRLLQFLAVLLFLSVVLLLLAVSGVHATRHHHADVRGEHRLGISGEMQHHAVARWWSRTIVRFGGGGHGGGHGGHGGHGHGHGRGHGTGDDGHGTGGTPFYPRTVTGHGHHRSTAAPVTGRRPSAVAARPLLLVVAAYVVLLLRL